VDRFVAVVWLRLISVPRCRLDVTVGRQDADVAHHHPGEKKNTQPGHYEAVSRQPHREELYMVLHRRQAKSLRRASRSRGVFRPPSGRGRLDPPCFKGHNTALVLAQSGIAFPRGSCRAASSKPLKPQPLILLTSKCASCSLSGPRRPTLAVLPGGAFETPNGTCADGTNLLQMAVLVKPNGLFGTAYMAAIRPFRHLIVYPPAMRQIEREWRPRRAKGK
jgi:hypothetical protein